jgi:hypothetical protein
MNTKDNKLIYESYSGSTPANVWVDYYKNNLGGLYNYYNDKRQDVEAPHEIPGSQILDTIDKAETLIRKLYHPHLEQVDGRDLVSGSGSSPRYQLFYGEVGPFEDGGMTVHEWEGLIRLSILPEPEWWRPDDSPEEREPGFWEEGDDDEVNFANLPELWFSIDRRLDDGEMYGHEYGSLKRVLSNQILITHDNQDEVLKEIQTDFEVYRKEARGGDDMSDWDF